MTSAIDPCPRYHLHISSPHIISTYYLIPHIIVCFVFFALYPAASAFSSLPPSPPPPLQLLSHNLISHTSSHTTHLTHTPQLTPLISNNSSHTTHLTQVTSNNLSHNSTHTTSTHKTLFYTTLSHITLTHTNLSYLNLSYIIYLDNSTYITQYNLIYTIFLLQFSLFSLFY